MKQTASRMSHLADWEAEVNVQGYRVASRWEKKWVKLVSHEEPFPPMKL